MKSLLNEEKLKEDLLNEDFDWSQIERILKVLNKYPITISEFKKGNVISGDGFEIKFSTNKDVLTNSDFEINIPGVDNRRICSLEIPKLSYDDIGVFKLKLEVYPFDISQFGRY